MTRSASQHTSPGTIACVPRLIQFGSTLPRATVGSGAQRSFSILSNIMDYLLANNLYVVVGIVVFGAVFGIMFVNWLFNSILG